MQDNVGRQRCKPRQKESTVPNISLKLYRTKQKQDLLGKGKGASGNEHAREKDKEEKKKSTELAQKLLVVQLSKKGRKNNVDGDDCAMALLSSP